MCVPLPCARAGRRRRVRQPHRLWSESDRPGEIQIVTFEMTRRRATENVAPDRARLPPSGCGKCQSRGAAVAAAPARREHEPAPRPCPVDATPSRSGSRRSRAKGRGRAIICIDDKSDWRRRPDEKGHQKWWGATTATAPARHSLWPFRAPVMVRRRGRPARWTCRGLIRAVSGCGEGEGGGRGGAGGPS